MSLSQRLTIATAVAGLAASAAMSLAQQTVYAIGNGGSSLVRFQSNDPTNLAVVANFSGAAGFLDAIDFRPSTGQLYGYLDSTDSFYTVNLTTGALTLASAGASSAPTNTFQLGLDFNPTIDRARIVTDSAQNIVFNPVSGTVSSFTTLAYALGDPNENASPGIIDNAYTQNFAGSTITRQFGIDYGTDSLVTIANNAGTLVTIGALGVNTDIYTGFDIFTGPGGIDTAYAILTTPAGVANFYTIDLTTGQASLVGGLGSAATQIYSLAVIPAPGAASTFVLAGFIAARRRR